MSTVMDSVMEKRIAKVIRNLEKNNMQGFYVPRKQDVVPLVSTLLKQGDTVAVGGSMTLMECGVIDHLRSGRYHFIDRYQEGLTREQVEQGFRESFFADAYLCSSNAITEKGELYNVDGNSNRIAAICYGPKSVIMVVGMNKIVPDLHHAVIRVKSFAAPANCERLSCQTYCKEKGECQSFLGNAAEMTEGCQSPARICCNYLVSAHQRHKDRIKVILVGETLGY